MSPSGLQLKIVDPFPVRCVDDSDVFVGMKPKLTVGKGYMVTAVSQHGTMYQLRGDDDLIHIYGATRFVELPLCTRCGDVVGLYYHEEFNHKLMQLGMCHSCEFWNAFKLDMIREPHRHFVIEGNGYSVNPDGRDIIGQAGHGGAEFFIKPNNQPHAFVSHNVWHRGVVPLAWVVDLPDNATFVDRNEFENRGH